MEKIIWNDRTPNEYLLELVKENEDFNSVLERKKRWIEYILRGESFKRSN